MPPDVDASPLHCAVLRVGTGGLPPQAAGLAALGWWLQELELAAAMPPGAPAAAPARPTVGLLWCPERTALAHALQVPRAAGWPVVLLSPPLDAAERRAALAAGVLAWQPPDVPAATLAEALLWARDLAAELGERAGAAQARLDERKWTERAKGVLMHARGIDEAAAFTLLRQTAMQTQARMADVARSIVRTAELAEALERAAAQRMLGQRLVKLQALRQWPRLCAAERREAQALHDDCAARIDGNLARLGELLRGELGEPVAEAPGSQPVAALAGVAAAWAQLRAALAQRHADLARSDEAAQRLLERSETLLGCLCGRAGQRPVAVLAQAARLRLLSQRLAKEGLLAQLLPGHDASGLAAGLDEFVRAYQALRAEPLAGPALQPAFAAVDEAWLLLLRGLRAEPSDAVQRMHQGSERLLQALEVLMHELQGCRQVMLG